MSPPSTLGTCGPGHTRGPTQAFHRGHRKDGVQSAKWRVVTGPVVITADTDPGTETSPRTACSWKGLAVFGFAQISHVVPTLP